MKGSDTLREKAYNNVTVHSLNQWIGRRINRTLFGEACGILCQTKLQEYIWGETMNHVPEIYNISGISTLNTLTAMEDVEDAVLNNFKTRRSCAFSFQSYLEPHCLVPLLGLQDMWFIAMKGTRLIFRIFPQYVLFSGIGAACTVHAF